VAEMIVVRCHWSLTETDYTTDNTTLLLHTLEPVLACDVGHLQIIHVQGTGRRINSRSVKE
jgi:hypothetical protein